MISRSSMTEAATDPSHSGVRPAPAAPSGAKSFWEERLQGLSHPTPVPRHLAGEEKAHGDPRAALTREVSLSRLTLGALVESLGIDPEVPVIGAWARLLGIYSGEEKVFFLVKLRRQGRVGHWPLVVPLPAAQKTSGWLKEIQVQLESASLHSPLEVDSMLQHRFPIEGWESVLDFSDDPTAPALGPLQIRGFLNGSLKLELISAGGRLNGETLSRIGEHLVMTLSQLVEKCEEPLAQIEVLPGAEREKILVEWNQTGRDYPPDSLKEGFERQAEKNPTGQALLFPASADNQEATLTYAELNRRANQLAHYLKSHKAGPDVVIGICADRSVEMATAVLAVVKAGSAYVPLDPTYPPERLVFMLEDTSAPVILAQRKYAHLLPPSSQLVFLDDPPAAINQAPQENLPTTAGGDHLTYLIYTSGSTGKPKGVAMRQQPLVNLLQWQFENWTARPDARTLQFASLNFDVSFQEIFSTWLSGGTLVLISEAVRRDSRALVRFLDQHQVERLFLPFVALKHLAEASQQEGIIPRQLKEVITAGEQLQVTPAMVQMFRKLPQAELHNQYGPSETHVVTAYRLHGDPQTWPQLPGIGKAIANTTTYILDPLGRPVPIGVAGELFLGGVSLARGYLNRPELTAEKFLPNPFLPPPERIYKTGDLARYLPDGNIEFLGRIDHQVKIRGFRIELGEVEAALLKHPSMKEAVVVAREWNGGDKRLVAYVVVASGKSATPSDLRGFLREHLPPYMVPTAFVFLPALPLTPNGKVDRKALPLPKEEVEEENGAPVKPPADSLQVQLKLVFERFLNRRPIGVDVSFFELGGDSLQALQLIVEIERATGKKLPLGILFQAPTVESLARAIQEDCESEEFSCMVSLHPKGTRPPFFLVHTTPGDVFGYGNLMYHIHPDQPCYGFQSLGLHREELSHRRLEEMAAYYVDLLRKFQPKGPYYLGGWCYGGMVAVEMAHQLNALGEKIAFLGLFETPAPAPTWRVFRYYAHRLACLIKMGPRRWCQYLQAKFRYYSKVRQENDMRFARDEKSDSSGRSRLLARLEHVYHTNMAALNFYRSRPFAGKVTLFNAVEDDPTLINDPLYGWVGLAAEIESYVVPGGHDTILMEPYVKVLAGQLDQCLTRAQAASGSSPTRSPGGDKRSGGRGV